jgi:hypothetical protein
LLLHNEKELVLFMKHSDRQTEMEIPEWKFFILQHTLIFMFILFSFVFMYIHVFLCVYPHSLFEFVWM